MTFAIYASLNSIHLSSEIIKKINDTGAWSYLVPILACASIPLTASLLFSSYLHTRKNSQISALQERLSHPEHIRLVRTKRDLYDELYSTVSNAKELIITSGSRSRDARYLNKLREKLADSPNIEFYSILFGPPRYQVFKDHLERVLKQVPQQRVSDGTSNVHIAILQNPGRLPERFICASETKAVLPLQSFNRIDEYDSALVITDPKLVGELVAQFKNMDAMPGAKKISTHVDLPAVEAYA